MRRDLSARIRDAVREYLHGLEIQQLELRDRAGYLKHPPDERECGIWDPEAAWPEE